MASQAMQAWQGQRRTNLQELYDAHASVGGVGRGRRTATGQINSAITLSLAGEFQGYARDLHDEATSVLAATASTPALLSVLQATFTANRLLDRGNATASALQQDFQRIGIPILDGVKAADARAETWLARLGDLNTARNAIAHSQPARLLPVLEGDPTLRLARVRRWHAAVGHLVVTMDRVVARDIGHLTNGSAPW